MMFGISMQNNTVPVFVFRAIAIEALDAGSLAEYDARYVVAPFERFVLRSDVSAMVVAGATMERPTKVPLLQVEVCDLGSGRFQITETLAGGFLTNLVLDVDNATICVAGEKTAWNLDTFADAASAGRIVVGLLLALNHRDVITVETPPTRQQRRHAERGEKPAELIHYVNVGENIIEYAARVAAGRDVKKRAAHLVRSHIRRMRSGKEISVTAHKRGYGKAPVPLYDATKIL